MTRIYLLEDHASFRKAFASILDREPDFEVVGQAGSLTDSRNGSWKDPTEVDVAVVGLLLPDGNGMELIRDLREANPHIPTIVLTISRDTEVHAWAKKIGADRVLTKDSSIQEIIAEIRNLGTLRTGEQIASQVI